MRIPARILATASELPGRRVTTAEVLSLTTLERPVEVVEQKTGITERRWAAPDQTMAEVAARVLGRALEDAALAPTALSRIIFVCSTAGDQILPPTSNLVMHHLGLAGHCDCFDLNNACMGFLSAFDIASRMVQTGAGPVGVVVVEMPSRHIRPDDPRPFVVFGDAAAAAVIGPAAPGQGGALLGIHLGNDPSQGGALRFEHPCRTGDPGETLRFLAPNQDMARVALGALTRSAHRALAQAGLTVDEVDWLVPHQPNGRMLDGILEALAIPEAKLARVVDTAGSTGAASMPLGLDRLLRTRPVKPGDRILLAGVGTGVSYGAMVYEV